MTAPFKSTTWHFALILRPERESWITGVAHAAWKGGVSTLNFGAGFPKSASLPASTKELYRATVFCSGSGGIG